MGVLRNNSFGYRMAPTMRFDSVSHVDFPRDVRLRVEKPAAN